ncbi:small ribosomal subunit protein uS5m [Pogona vitticeps]
MAVCPGRCKTERVALVTWKSREGKGKGGGNKALTVRWPRGNKKKMAAALASAAQRVCSPWIWRTAWRGCAFIPSHGAHCQYTTLANALQKHCYVSAPPSVTVQQYRQSSFFGKLTADEIWKAVVAQSSSSKNRARGKRTKKKIKLNLNRGQMIGEGRSGILWPGLSAPILNQRSTLGIQRREKEEQGKLMSERLIKREEWEKKMRRKVKKERGFTGASWNGISLGHPDPSPDGETYEDFDSTLIELKTVSTMTAKEGRRRSFSALVVVGNKKGAAGFALGKANVKQNALRKAKNKAIHNLHYIERYNNHTIYHDISSTFHQTTIRMKKQSKGYGLHCHRAIIAMCKLIGIEDMYAKLYGSNNPLNLTKAFFKGLANQKTHQKLADEKSLYVVEFRDECGPLPIVVAKPQGPVREDPEPEDEVSDIIPEWREVRAAQGAKSRWANLKRTIW